MASLKIKLGRQPVTLKSFMMKGSKNFVYKKLSLMPNWIPEDAASVAALRNTRQ